MTPYDYELWFALRGDEAPRLKAPNKIGHWQVFYYGRHLATVILWKHTQSLWKIKILNWGAETSWTAHSIEEVNVGAIKHLEYCLRKRLKGK